MAEEIATGDTENTDTPETTATAETLAPSSSETTEATPAKPRKSRARKIKVEPMEIVAETPAEAELETTPVVEYVTTEPIAEKSIEETKEKAVTNTTPVDVAAQTETRELSTEPVIETAVAEETIEVTSKKPAKKRTSTRKSPSKATAADRKSTRSRKAPEETATPASSVDDSESNDTPTIVAEESAPQEGVIELTEATKRRRKPRVLDESGNEIEDAEETSKRRTAASAKTSAPRTRKTIKPADETTTNDEGTDETKPKSRTTKSATNKATPKPRSRKPKTDETTAVAIPDPSAPSLDDEPLVMDAKDAIAEGIPAPAPETENKPKRNRKTRAGKNTTPEPAAEEVAAPLIAEAEAALASTTTSSDAALGSARTVIASPTPQPTIIERVPVPSSKRVTMTIIFLVIGLVGLGAGWALGSATNEKSGSPTTHVPGNTTPSNPTTTGVDTLNPGANATAGNRVDLFTLSGSNPRQSALFTLPANVVTLHFDSTGGTFSAKLLPQTGGDGTTFDCSSACDKEQPIQAPPGSYYFDIQSSGGDWNIRVSE